MSATEEENAQQVQATRPDEDGDTIVVAVPKQRSMRPAGSQPPVAKRPSRSQKAAPKASAPPKKSLDHIVLVNAIDCDMLTNFVELAGGLDPQIRILEIHLDAGKVDDLFDFRLAVALTALHPRNDGENPHRLLAIKIILKGTYLYTRYAYHLTSPALSEDVNQRLMQLATGGLSEQDKLGLTYAISSNEKSVANALLGLRAIKHVLIEGLGRMEGEFAQVVKRTLTQPPGTTMVEPVGSDPVALSTLQLYGQGTAVSRQYYLREQQTERQGERGFLPYATRTITQRHDFSTLTAKQRYLIDEKQQLLGHWLSKTDAEARETGAAVVPKCRYQRPLRVVVVDDDAFDRPEHGASGRAPAPKRKRDWKEELGIERTVRFRVRKDEEEEKKKRKKDKEVKDTGDGFEEVPGRKRLTDLVNSVELGWKVR